MKSRRRTKRSEPFWPSIVMKKWLNIAPKANEFSEDEVDTETESEDDASSDKDIIEDMGRDPFYSTLGTLPVGPRKTSGKTILLIESKGSARSTPKYNDPTTRIGISHDGRPLRNRRRRKSETLRVQYIDTKDVRLMIGTWNVAGRPPPEDLEIDEWLCLKEPADMYIIGFQEVVPLNAGNVLGAEDARPIPKWEEIIRRTLNKSLQPETKLKSYSCPTSPVQPTSSSVDAFAAVGVIPEVDILRNIHGLHANGSSFEKEGANAVLQMGKKFQLEKMYGINGETKLDWPEQSLDAPPVNFPSKIALRRVLSSHARMGFGWMENPFSLNCEDQDLDCALRRVRHSSGDLGLLWRKEERRDVFDAVSDVSDISDEDDCSLMEQVESNYGLDEDNRKTHPTYVRIVSKQMVGIYVSVWVRRRLRRHINNLKVSPVGVGLMGYMGNKGSVSLSMSLYQTRICFVCSHLTSGHKEGDAIRRNSDVNEILRRTQFSSVINDDQPQKIPCHDQIFWFGDLNYRLDMLDPEVRKLVAKKKWAELINSDQLSKELRFGRVFYGWKEGLINFPPTYKYAFNSDRYVGEEPKEGEKKRSPAWCDRILWSGKGIKQLSYDHTDIRISDHRPVSSVFLVEVEVFDHRKLKRALNFTNALVHPEVFLSEEED